MKLKTLLMISMTCALILSISTISSALEEQKWCPLCGMNLKMFHKTNHRITFKDGSQTTYCSIHCAAIVHREKPDKIDKVEVVDFVSKTFILADEAYYLVGSDLPGTMTVTSKLAFATPDEALNYEKKHGGIIARFPEALAQASKDLGADMKMLKKKMSKMAKMGKKAAEAKGCFKCHGPGGKGIGTARAWTSPGFARRMDSKVKIKKTIVQGRGEMPSFEGKIPEKELQALMLYIWSLRSEQ